MEDLNDKITGGTLLAVDWNQPASELQNIIEATGQSLTNADLNQAGKGVAEYVSNGNFYTDSGGANAYVLTSIGSKQSPPRLVDGMTAEFIVGTTNTTSSTVNQETLGVKNIVNTSNGGELTAGQRILLKYRLGADNYEIVPIPSTTTVSNYVSAIKTYLHVDGANSTAFVVSTEVTVNSWESVGPTGAGASNLWTALDDLPAGATIAIVQIDLDFTASAIDTNSELRAFVRQTGSSATNDDSTEIAELRAPTDDKIGTYSTHTQVLLPLDPSFRFDIRWENANTATAQVEIRLKGFMGP